MSNVIDGPSLLAELSAAIEPNQTVISATLDTSVYIKGSISVARQP